MEKTMAQETFTENLMRTVVAELHFLNCVTAGRDMFGRSYFSLGATEKAAVDQAVLGAIGGNYSAITKEWLAGQKAEQAMGFVPPSATHKGS
jgi:hypothetical protein